MTEAEFEAGVPVTAGWFVVNARDARWLHNEMRSVCCFGGEGEAHFDDLGVCLYWVEPGKPMSLYHHEAGQEDFLLLRGEAILIVEGDERPLRAWDFFHCPPRTRHTIVAGRLVVEDGRLVDASVEDILTRHRAAAARLQGLA